MRVLISFVIASFIFSGSFILAQVEGIPNFHQVDTGVYRGGRLRQKGILELVVEVVDTKEKLDEIMPKIDELMVGGGMITIEKATVIRYSNRNEK